MAASNRLVDVKALIDGACGALPVGQLIKTENFNLFEAMSALEVGNVKMDPSCQPPTKTVHQMIGDGMAPLELSSGQLLAVIDHLMCLEATWHTGASAAQTIYASLYMLAPDRTADNVVLSAYCKALEGTSREIRNAVYNGCVCDEEDFNVHVIGLPIEDAGRLLGAGAQPARMQ